MTHDDVEIIQNNLVYDGFYKMRQFSVKHRLFQGGWSPTFQREMMQRPPAVVVLPYDPVLDEVVLIKQFRIGALDDQHSPWLWELVAGLVEPGEPVEQVVRRELKEEAGLVAAALLPVAEFWTSPGGTNEYVSLYCVQVDASQADGVHGMAHEHEDILVKRFKAADTFAMITRGEINNAAAITGLFWLQLQQRHELFQ